MINNNYDNEPGSAIKAREVYKVPANASKKLGAIWLLKDTNAQVIINIANRFEALVVIKSCVEMTKKVKGEYEKIPKLTEKERLQLELMELIQKKKSISNLESSEDEIQILKDIIGLLKGK